MLDSRWAALKKGEVELRDLVSLKPEPRRDATCSLLGPVYIAAAGKELVSMQTPYSTVTVGTSVLWRMGTHTDLDHLLAFTSDVSWQLRDVAAEL